jgi:hypothetical protein
MSRRRIETRRTFYGKSDLSDPLAGDRALAATTAMLTEILLTGTSYALPRGNFGKNQ